MQPILYDVVIVGGGVSGCAIARVLSSYQIKILLIEATDDVAMGASRANSGIVHAGYDAQPGSLMARLNVEGNRLFDEWTEQLGVPMRRSGSLVLAFNDEEMRTVHALYERGLENNVPGMQVLSGDEARKRQPGISDDVVGALYAATGGITCPYELTIACAENARQNGVEFLFDAPVTQIEFRGDKFELLAGEHKIAAKYVINAAGVYADKIAQLVGDNSFSILPRKGEYMLMDKAANPIFTVIFQTPSALGKGVLVAPTVDGNVFAGPTAVNVDDREDTSVTPEGLEEMTRLSKRSVPNLNLRAVIRSFAGLRAQPSTGDFVIGPSETNDRFINVAGICSPGLTSAPAVALMVADILKNQGLAMEENPTYDPIREPIAEFRRMDNAQRAEAIRKDSRYGRMICRCEYVTEGEIVEAIRRGARSVDAVKRRVRAGMGRCQGGFCAPRVIELISRELNIPIEEVTKFGGNSKMLAGKLGEEESQCKTNKQ